MDSFWLSRRSSTNKQAKRAALGVRLSDFEMLSIDVTSIPDLPEPAKVPCVIRSMAVLPNAVSQTVNTPEVLLAPFSGGDYGADALLMDLPCG